MNVINENNIKGGKVIASGGFGCVFSPALKCKGAKIRRGKNSISKLLTKKHALSEYNEIKEFKSAKIDFSYVNCLSQSQIIF